MEKYTIDIDKVLDDFEETEALKVNTEDSVDNCLLSADSICYDERNNLHLKNKIILNGFLPFTNSSNEISLKDNVDPAVPLDNVSTERELLTSNYEILDGERKLSVSNDSLKNVNIHTGSTNYKHINYDIFYKSQPNSYSTNQKSENFVHSKNKTDNISEFYLEDSNQEEILCISVQEWETNESKHSECIPSSNEVALDKFSTESFNTADGSSIQEYNNSNHIGTIQLQKDQILSDKNVLKGISQTAQISDLKKVQPVLFKEEINKLYIEPIALENTSGTGIADTKSSADLRDSSSNLTCIDGILPKSTPLEKEDIHESNISSESVLNNCFEQTTKSSTFTVPKNLNLYVSNSQNSGLICFVNQTTSVQDQEKIFKNTEIKNDVVVQDEDSGVSSTEDISGNSPPEVLNDISNSTIDKRCKFKTEVSNSHAFKEVDYNINISNEMKCQPFNLSTYEDENCNTDKKCEYDTVVKELGDANINDFVSTSEYASEKLNSNEKCLKGDEIFSDSIKDDHNNFINLTDAIISNKNDAEVTVLTSSESLIFSGVTDDINETVATVNVEEITKNETNLVHRDNLDLEDNFGSKSTVSEKDDFSQRLQRPTTLDVPSLQKVPSEHAPSVSPSSELPEMSSDLDRNLEQLLQLTPDTLMNKQNAEELNPNTGLSQVGMVKPYWVPDSEALNCMHCDMKFTVLKRRHHCRGCGKVLCSRCCNQKAFLEYLNKEDRICFSCSEFLSTTQTQIPGSLDSQSLGSCGSSPTLSPTSQTPASNFEGKNLWKPHPNNPDDYCSTIPPLQQIQSGVARSPPTVMVPIGSKPRREPKQVIFSDGIRPGGDLSDLSESNKAVPIYHRIGNFKGSPISPPGLQTAKQQRFIVYDEVGPLPPVILETECEDKKMDWNNILQKLQDDKERPINFALLKNLHLFVKITKLDCCFGSECWCFTSHGLCTVGQDEVVVILERLPNETSVPRDIFKFYTQIYDSASKGSTFDDLGHIIFPEQILGSNDHRGFLFVRPTFQCLSKLIVPNTSYLVAILILKWEVPWAKVFPLRLMLRMGAECRYYPCSLVSVRHRKPVYFEIGQTIMSVLSDLRNYQFTIPIIPGLVVHMEEKKTCVNIPRNRYEKVMKVLNSNNVEHVLALGSNFSTEADSHLVCMQKEEGEYQTQAINIENTTRKVTGASFVVFSGALKTTSGLSAKFSIVEDGLLIQIPQETMAALHMALRDMKDLTIQCGQIGAVEPEETVSLQWTKNDKNFNVGVQSPIDGKNLEGIPSLRIHTSTDYASEYYLIRWTEVFFFDTDIGVTIHNESVDPCRFAETVAQSCCMTLTPFLDQLAEAGLFKLGFRVTLDSQRDRVEFDVGACSKPLPTIYMNALDNGLIPIILRLSSSVQHETISFELIFHILIK